MPPLLAMGEDLVQSQQERQTKAFLRIRLVPGLGLRTCHRLLAAVGDPETVLSLREKELVELSVPGDLARDLASGISEERAELEWARARAIGVRIINMKEADYPALLLETFDPPLVLYVRGQWWDPARPHVAIVGARRATTYGLQCAERIARELAAHGIVIASGLARGIDTAAHRGALASGKTIAVLGTGIDRVYPPENRAFADSITSNGALLSEFPVATPPLAPHFPLRNRILAGLTLGTIVVEAAERSGSLITARLALEANREVFAVPGPIHSPKSAGTHQLIRQGACLVTGCEDVIEELPVEVRSDLVPEAPEAPDRAPELAGVERQVRDALSLSEETAIDDLLSKLRRTPSEIYSALLRLELAGIVRQLPGDRYVLAP